MSAQHVQRCWNECNFVVKITRRSGKERWGREGERETDRQRERERERERERGRFLSGVSMFKGYCAM